MKVNVHGKSGYSKITSIRRLQLRSWILISSVDCLLHFAANSPKYSEFPSKFNYSVWKLNATYPREFSRLISPQNNRRVIQFFFTGFSFVVDDSDGTMTRFDTLDTIYVWNWYSCIERKNLQTICDVSKHPTVDYTNFDICLITLRILWK